MEEILKRIKQLRVSLGMRQTDFAKRFDMAGNSWSQIETGKTPLKDRHIALICLTFAVNESWLRTGQGEMFVKKPGLSPQEMLLATPILDDDGNQL